VKQQQLLKENLADRAAELLSQQDELLKDLNDDYDSEDEKHSADILKEAVEIISFRSIAPVAAGMQLHLILLPDLLLDCLSFLQDPKDIMNVMLVCKLFSSVAGDDMLWWRFQSRFINDPSSDSSSEVIASPTLSKSTSSSTSADDGNSDHSPQTWVCSRCQLTQALATSTHCEMCLSEKDLSSGSGPLTSISPADSTGFIIVKSAEHLAALWIEGSKNYKDREGKLSGNVNVTNIADSSKSDESPAICNASKLTGMPVMKNTRKVF
jgi:F-box-like